MGCGLLSERPPSGGLALWWVAAAVVGLFDPSVAGAATVQFDTQSSEVLVNTGNGFRRVESGTQVKPGDVVTTNSGVARVIYTSVCFNDVNLRQVHRVASQDQCVPDKTDPINAPQGGVIDPNVVTGVIVAGGVAGAAAIIISTSGSSSP